MSVVITVMNMKGGVGKTTVAMHVAGAAARYELNGKFRNVLAIDYDPQFNMSQAFLPAKTYFGLEKQKKTTLSILIDDPSNLDPYKLQVPGNHQPPKVAELVTPIYSYKNACLHLIPSTLDLMYVALGQATTQTKPIEERFQKFIDECRSHYDLVIIDCHPAGSLFTKTSLRNSDSCCSATIRCSWHWTHDEIHFCEECGCVQPSTSHIVQLNPPHRSFFARN
jgi:chromosome partitioning protein